MGTHGNVFGDRRTLAGVVWGCGNAVPLPPMQLNLRTAVAIRQLPITHSLVAALRGGPGYHPDKILKTKLKGDLEHLG